MEDEGDTTTHDNRNKLTVSMLEVALKDDDYDADQVLEKENFIRALHVLRMVGCDGPLTVGLSSNEALTMVT